MGEALSIFIRLMSAPPMNHLQYWEDNLVTHRSTLVSDERVIVVTEGEQVVAHLLEVVSENDDGIQLTRELNQLPLPNRNYEHYCTRGDSYNFETLALFDDKHSTQPTQAWDVTQDELPEIDPTDVHCQRDQMTQDFQDH